ncbi:MAG: HAD-IC family P-type ATPase [Bacillota bacterium]
MTLNKATKKIEKAKTKTRKDSTKHKKAIRYNPDINTGLTQDMVNQRIEDNLTNDKPINRSKSYGRIIFENVFNFCNTVTIILVAILIAVGQPNQTVSSSIILANMIIGISQEIKAKWTVEKLSLVVDSSCQVLRNGMKKTMSTKELVLDDLFYLNAGMQTPVDGKVVEGVLETDESILTGESRVVKKNPDDKLLAASYVVAGSALVMAEKVGKDCYIENVARIARRVSKPKSNIFKVLDNIIKTITFALVPLALLLFISTRVVAGATMTNTIMQVAGSILGMLPIGMFLLTSTALASSVLKLSKKNTLAQDLYSVEMLAMVDTLLLDKTGTITDGNLEVNMVIPLSNEAHDLKSIITTLVEATHDKNPTALALKEKYKDGNKMKVIDIMPFSSKRKLSAVEVENNQVYCLGAPDFIVDNSIVLDEFINNSNKSCQRTLVLARYKGDIKDLENIKKENMIPLYAFSLEDKLRGDVKETLNWFYENEVDIKIVSGDNPLTVSQIAEATGVKNYDKLINCSEISDEKLDEKALDTTIFGRVAPEQKSKLVSILQQKGRVVGMIGDGVNDVQALKEADCSISFASANEVARNISRIVLMDNDFKTLPDVVGEGRRVISNVQKTSSLYIMKNLFVMFMTVLFAIMAFVVRQDLYPFIPTRMLLIEFFVIGVPTFAFALQANPNRAKGNFLRNIMKSCVPAAMSLIMGVGLVLILMFTGVIDFSAIDSNLYDYRSSLAVITFTFSGFAALFIIALPLNRYRLIIIFSMIALAITGMFLDQIIMDGWFLTIELITDPIHIMWIFVGMAVSIVCHIVFRKLINKFDDKWGDKLQNRLIQIKNFFVKKH